MVLLNLGIEIDEWMDKSLWLNSLVPHLRQTIKKESGYYTLSVEQMLEIAKGEEDARSLLRGQTNPNRHQTEFGHRECAQHPKPTNRQTTNSP
eukprot:SAG11_NODE_479_length_9108_cov_3.699856_9_plen_93_part_00